MLEVNLDPRLLVGLSGQTQTAVAVATQLRPQVAGRGEQAGAELALAARAGLELPRLLERIDPDL